MSYQVKNSLSFKNKPLTYSSILFCFVNVLCKCLYKKHVQSGSDEPETSLIIQSFHKTISRLVIQLDQ